MTTINELATAEFDVASALTDDDLDMVAGGKDVAYIQAAPIGNFLVHISDKSTTVVYYPPGTSGRP
jgi:hypothetical protein